MRSLVGKLLVLNTLGDCSPTYLVGGSGQMDSFQGGYRHSSAMPRSRCSAARTAAQPTARC